MDNPIGTPFADAERSLIRVEFIRCGNETYDPFVRVREFKYMRDIQAHRALPKQKLQDMAPHREGIVSRCREEQFV